MGDAATIQAATQPPRDALDGPAVELLRISKRFGGTEALRDVSLAIARGQTTVLIGPSGCGKSTLLRSMMALVEPDAGEVRFDGRPLARPSAREARLHMGYVIQDGGLLPHLSAGDNVALMARYLGWPGARVRARLEELARLARLPLDALRRFPVQLSGGQRQRVSLMRALMLDPHLLLMDEPLGALDPMIRAELQQDLRDIFRTLKKTVVLVTHDLAEGGFFGDWIVLMREGRVVQQGTLRQLRETPAEPFVSQFIHAQRQVHEGADACAA